MPSHLEKKSGWRPRSHFISLKYIFTIGYFCALTESVPFCKSCCYKIVQFIRLFPDIILSYTNLLSLAKVFFNLLHLCPTIVITNLICLQKVCFYSYVHFSIILITNGRSYFLDNLSSWPKSPINRETMA